MSSYLQATFSRRLGLLALFSSSSERVAPVYRSFPISYKMFVFAFLDGFLQTILRRRPSGCEFQNPYRQTILERIFHVIWSSSFRISHCLWNLGWDLQRKVDQKYICKDCRFRQPNEASIIIISDLIMNQLDIFYLFDQDHSHLVSYEYNRSPNRLWVVSKVTLERGRCSTYCACASKYFDGFQQRHGKTPNLYFIIVRVFLELASVQKDTDVV